MGIQVALHHRTRYLYERAVRLGPQVIQLRPTPYCRTPILSYSLDVTPADHILHWQFDAVGNHVARIIFPTKTTEFAIEVDLIADLTPINPFAFFLEPGFETYPFQYSPDLARDLEPYLTDEPAGPLLRALVKSLPGEKQPTVAFLVDLNRRIRRPGRLRVAPGAWRSDLRRDAGATIWILPRFRVAACAGLPATGNRCALRLRISDPVGNRRT